MSERYCESCYFNETCPYWYECYGVVSDIDLIENNRVAYRAEWFEYIEEFEN